MKITELEGVRIDRKMKDPDELITPEECLKDMLYGIQSGKLNPKVLVVCALEEFTGQDPQAKTTVSWSNSTESNGCEMIGMLEHAKIIRYEKG
ncbi:MAG: hypothetical protein OXD01_04990 [Gammaproteobacteria bacterium]|nr:hypothetical protein [Gammaproteobacteria bacterium]